MTLPQPFNYSRFHSCGSGFEKAQDLFHAASQSQDHQSAAFPLWLWCGVSRILRWEQSRLFGHLPSCAAANSLTRIILPVDVYVPVRWFIGNNDTTDSADVAYAYLNDPRCCRVFNENIRFRCLVRTKRGDLMASTPSLKTSLPEMSRDRSDGLTPR